MICSSNNCSRGSSRGSSSSSSSGSGSSSGSSSTVYAIRSMYCIEYVVRSTYYIVRSL